ncbi:MAG: tagaturonate reductase [Oscillospiraceae bacterium]|nr:tagaturonate reductase [Oscillospiraceae bacterium]
MERLRRKSKSELKERVLQFGEGNFLRGFADWMIDRLNNECDWGGGVVVVQPLPVGRIDNLNEQDGLYGLCLRGRVNGRPEEDISIIKSIVRGINPYKDFDKYMECAKNPDLRFIISNTTEAGIEYKENQSENDFAGITFPARLAIFLKARFESGLGGFIFLPCELIDSNGDALKECILKYARDWHYGSGFCEWLEKENYFANTLVDRIVTGYPSDEAGEIQKRLGYTDTMLDTAEIYHLWVIQGNKEIAAEIPFHKTGLNVLWKEDIKPYKKRKVRILNGAHTMTVPAALSAGFETVGEVMHDDTMLDFIKKGVFDEIIPTLDLPENELIEFADDVLQRFDNPFIKHYLTSIALNSVSKFRVRVLPSITEYIRIYDKEPKILVFSLSAMIDFYKTSPQVNDDESVAEFMKNASVSDILKKEEYWGTDLSFLKNSVERYIDMIKEKGIKKAIEITIG